MTNANHVPHGGGVFARDLRRSAMIYKQIGLVCALVAVGIAGCTPRVRVRANPTAHDEGIRYYRPKPYLFVTSAGEITTTTDKEGTSSKKEVPDERYVNIQLQYLPDFAEEYAIDVRSGFGIADVSITLEDGWNLTAINQKLDSQTDENIAAAAELIKGVTGALNPGQGRGFSGDVSRNQTYEMKIRATNVPLGYYESVVGRDSCGRKQLYGFRYIGFMPFQSCPVAMHGNEVNCCESAALYGLVFDRGVMVFKPLGEIAGNPDPSGRVEVATAIASDSGSKSATVTRQLTYSNGGVPGKATITVQDTFDQSLESDGRVKVNLPLLSDPALLEPNK